MRRTAFVLPQTIFTLFEFVSAINCENKPSSSEADAMPIISAPISVGGDHGCYTRASDEKLVP